MDLGTTKMIARVEGGIGWMIFNQPEKHNAVSLEMWHAVPKIIAAFETDPEVRVIVLAGAGERAFVSGADISEFDKKRSSEDTVKIYDKAGEDARDALAQTSKPTISMIRGICYGGGVAIALQTDIRICSADSVFAVPAAKLGLGYGHVGVKRLLDVVGPSFTKEIFYTARQFKADEAQMMGLVNRIVPDAELESYVKKYAETIAGNAPLTIKALKLVVGELLKDESKRDVGGMENAVMTCFRSEDYLEGRNAFMEKRKPAFTGT
jgi:enoyl-CoA hydratase